MSEEEEDEFDEDEVREALRAVHAGEIELSHVLSLAIASFDLEKPLVPEEVSMAIAAKFEMDRDVANGGLDQVAWNHGLEATRAYANAFRAVGAIENADVLDRLASALEEYEKKHTREAISKDPVQHFLAYRKSVSGPFFGIPEPGDELAEVLIEYVLDHASAVPPADTPLVRKAQ